MNTTVKIDKAGRVVLPKSLRDELQLEPGDRLALVSEGEDVRLRPVRSEPSMRKEDGIWVFRSGRKVTGETVEKVLQSLRRERENEGQSGSYR